MRAVREIAASTTIRLGHQGVRRRFIKGAAVILLTSLVVMAPTTATAKDSAANRSGDPAVISEWNEIAQNTLFADTTKAPVEDILYMGFMQAAVYNAVVGIEGRYEPYHFKDRAPRRASSQAAAAAAAHKILVTYSPSAQADLDARYKASLAKIPDGKAKTRGIRFGELAAGTLIDQRKHDGRNADIRFTQQPAPGVWRPTPPAFAPFTTPWLGFVTPLLVRNGAQFGKIGPPPRLTSARYTRDFNEVKALSSSSSTERTAEQTNTALFYSGSAFVQFNTALREQVGLRKLDIVDAARMFAAVDMSFADVEISVWYSKYVYGFWRPITAIQLADTDGNPATTADPAWTPLRTTPSYPEYVSGYAGGIGAFTRALQDTFDTQHLQLTFISTAPEATGLKRSYDSGREARQAVVDARVWLGFHFRTADTRGARMGQDVAEWALDHYFGPVGRH
jgi:hypothetical protein